MNSDLIKNLGPLAQLAGVWEGIKGDDIAPSDDRGTENNKFKERLTLEPISQVVNHEQSLYGLRYSTVATRIGEAAPFHEEVGYWLWDERAQQVMRCFIVPRGVTVLAGGAVAPNAKTIELLAEQGSSTFGICSNPFLDREFKAVKYTLKITVHDDSSFSYEEHTFLQMKGRPQLFDHKDSNTLKKVSSF